MFHAGPDAQVVNWFRVVENDSRCGRTGHPPTRLRSKRFIIRLAVAPQGHLSGQVPLRGDR